jgi:tetratricopeptide (TPR) repeat protein
VCEVVKERLSGVQLLAFLITGRQDDVELIIEDDWQTGVGDVEDLCCLQRLFQKGDYWEVIERGGLILQKLKEERGSADRRVVETMCILAWASK